MIKDIGAKYGSITVQSIHTPATNFVCTKVWGKCECGDLSVYWIRNLRTGHTQSCGCLRSKNAGHPIGDHGKSKHPTYKRTFEIWQGMKARCHSPTNKRFPLYGARGISVCPQWRYDFAQFLSDMGRAPDDKKIERIHNDGNYEPGNCRWATQEDQMQNTRSTVPIVLDGVSMSVSKACRLVGLNKCNFDTHYRRKYNLNKEFTQQCFEETRVALSKRIGHRIPW